MPAPIRTSLTATYNALAQEASARGESNDCSVKALALVAGVSYAAAHAALAEAGGEWNVSGLRTAAFKLIF